jgi:hypothetical protein
MLTLVISEQDREFEDRGRRWAHCMLERLERHSMDIPLVWPGTREQARTIVRAYADESQNEVELEHLVDAVQNGARVAWCDLTAEVRPRALRIAVGSGFKRG